MSRHGKIKLKNGGAQFERGCTTSTDTVICGEIHCRGRSNSVLFGEETDEEIHQTIEAENDQIQNGVHMRHIGIETTTRTASTGEDEDEDEDQDADADGLLDAQKVDEWLKNRSDSLSSIEFDSCEIKQEDHMDEYESLIEREIANVDDQIPVKIRSATEQLAELFMKVSSPNNEHIEPHRCVPEVSSGCSRTMGAFNYVRNYRYMNKSILKQRKSPVVSPKRQIAKSADGAATSTAVSPVVPPLSNGVAFDGTSNVVKDIMLMTPQELERMPESGIEFEQSVGPKELENLISYNDQRETVTTSLDDPLKTAGLANSNEGTNSVNVSVETTESLNVAGDAPADVDASSTVATISISTDKTTNTTSIVINTKHGQQLFKISTANLMQAAATLEPFTLADLVHQSSSETLSITGEQQQLATGAEVPSSKELPPVTVDTNNTCQIKSILSNSAVVAVSSTDVKPNASKEIDEKLPIVTCVQDVNGMAYTVCTHSGRCHKVWTCPEPDCDKLFTKQSKLKVHVKTHSKLRPYRCDVEDCDWSFESVYKLKRHLETHGAAKDFVCDYEGCVRRFTTIYNLNSHKHMHDQPKSIRCPIESCELLFPTRRKMELHIKEHSDVEAPYKCLMDDCDKAYYTTNAMASHLRSHRKTTFTCPVEGCDIVFDKLSRFKSHMWRHTGERPYPCTYEGCKWAFSSASKLIRHTRKHTGERRYTCKEPGCSKSFMRLEHLQGHVVTHSGDKPYECHHADCDAKFTARSSLYVHLKKHDGRVEKVIHPCPIEACDKRYTCKSSLRIHMQRYHSTKQSPATTTTTTTTSTTATTTLTTATTTTTTVSASDPTHASHRQPEVEHITLLASDGVQDATTTVDERGQVINPTVNVAELCLVPGDELEIVPLIQIVEEAATLASQSAELPVSPSVTVVAAKNDSVVNQCLSSGTDASTSISELELPAIRILQENCSGSARTDYCSNHMLVERARKRRQLELEWQITEPFTVTADASIKEQFSNGTQCLVTDVLVYEDSLAVANTGGDNPVGTSLSK